ncbi:MAG: hypothetical protein AAF806_16750 [Bacteroidota bacterium]
MKYIIWMSVIGFILQSCSDGGVDKKGFQVNEISENEAGEKVVRLPIDSLTLETKPRNVLLTRNKNHRLVPVYKVNYDKKTGKPFTGSNAYHPNYWSYGESEGNNWNNNFMPGFEAVYGYNFVNISHYNTSDKRQKLFFEKPVLIKTLYYPAFSKDTLDYEAIERDFYMVSVYNEDTNGDGFINIKDLRRIYYFDINGDEKQPIVPENYSVLSSEYDPGNDYMYIFARKDENENGEMEYEESTNIFWVDLKEPSKNGIHYGAE